MPIGLSHAFSLGCGIAGVKLTTHLVPPADYGRFAIFASFAPIGMWFVHAGLIKFIGRHWAAAHDRPRMLSGTLGAMSRQLPWLAVITAVMALTLASAPWLWIWLILFVTATLLSVGALAQAALQAAQQHWRDFTVTAAGGITRSFAPPLLYAFAGASLLHLCGGLALQAAVSAAIGLWCLREYLAPGRGSEPVAPIYSGPLFVVLAFTGWVMAGLQRWIVASFFGATDAGYFALAASLAALVPAVLGTIALQYFQPAFFANPPDSDASRRALAGKIDGIALGHAALSLAGLLVLKLIAPLLIGRLIGQQYSAALDLLLPAGCAALALATGWFYHSLLLATKRESACGPVELSAAVVIMLGSVGTAFVGKPWFLHWLMLSPLLPWIVTRPLARHYLFKRDAGPTPAPAP